MDLLLSGNQKRIYFSWSFRVVNAVALFLEPIRRFICLLT